VRALHAGNSSFVEAVQLLRLWLAKHFFSGHFCQELLELLVAKEFIDTTNAPSTPFSAFSRTLRTLSSHDWDEDAFIVDFSDEITSEVRARIVTRCRAVRTTATASNLPLIANPPMYIVSSCDKVNDFQPSLSHKTPERVVLGMIVNAARRSLSKIGELLENPASIPNTPKSSFTDSVFRFLFVNNAVLRRCDHVFRFHKSIVCVDADEGPPFARLQVFSNMTTRELMLSNLVVL
jgi:hypothetical protein